MATKDEYYQAIDAVRSGNANGTQRHLAQRAANQAGGMGYEAREAFRKSGESDKYPNHKVI